MAGEMILHSDLNCFYASVEMNENPYLRGKAIAVCGSTEDRHGIVLTASYPAKRMGVKTGAANWQARQCCPGLICVPPHYELYLKYSKLVRRIYPRASAKAGQKDELFGALRANGYGDLITETINAGSLSSFVKEQIAENEDVLPGWLDGLVNVFEKTTVGVRKAAR